jgi:hypothetical protein
MHLRSISANEKHPRAMHAVISQPMNTGFEGADIQICNDIIAIVVRISNIPRVIIWQWTTGKLLMVNLWRPKPLKSQNSDEFPIRLNFSPVLSVTLTTFL